MSEETPRPTVDELFELLKKTALPTVLVEGKDDIIFYRKIEEALSHLGIDVLPAGNKDSVLRLMRKLEEIDKVDSIAFVVDKDLWVHKTPEEYASKCRLITTDGYSIENDLFLDGELLDLLSKKELENFLSEKDRFVTWYALAVSRFLSGKEAGFRTHPNKVLDDGEFYRENTCLFVKEEYPSELEEIIKRNYLSFLRGKSLLSLLHRQLSKKGRQVKFSSKQLMEVGGSRKGEKFNRLKGLIADKFE